jgi:hypothetical protein
MSRPRWLEPALVILFFIALLVVGLSVYDDFGISPDVAIDYRRGKMNYERMTGGSYEKFLDDCTYNETICYYPPFFSILLFRIAPDGLDRENIFTRHLTTYLFFVLSLVFFYFLAKKVFNDWILALLACIFLVVSPRIFSHSFNDPKDLPFLSAYIMAMYTMVRFIEKKNFLTAIIHGIMTGITCDIRTPGLVLIPITGIFLMMDYLKEGSKKWNWKSVGRIIALMLTSVACTALIIIIFMPILYTDPIGNYLKSFKLMSQFPWANYHLYLGENIKNNIPWHYSIVWFAISTPWLYVGLFIFGFLALITRTFFSKINALSSPWRFLHLVAICGLLPIIIVIATKSVIYTDNRQMYFCYPSLLLIAIYGVQTFLKMSTPRFRFSWVLVAIGILVGLKSPLSYMIRYHPYEVFYFNRLAGPSMVVIKERFTLDSWGLTDREGLEYILQNDPSDQIRVRTYEHHELNQLLLPEDERARLVFVNSSESADYVTTTYRNYPRNTFIEGVPVYSIEIGGAEVYTVYKIDP